MRTFVHVWVWFAFSILGFTFLLKAETFAVTQNLQSTFLITRYSETDNLRSPANKMGHPHPYVFLADDLGLLGPKVLRLSQIATYNPEIYPKTSSSNISTLKLESQAKKKGNGSEEVLAFLNNSDINSTLFQKGDFQLEKAEILKQDIIRLTFSDFVDPASAILRIIIPYLDWLLIG